MTQNSMRDLTGALSDLGFAGDWHENAGWAAGAVEYAASLGIKTLLHVGDFGYLFRPRFLDALEAACERWDVEVIAAQGNHDSREFLGWYDPDERGLLALRPHMAVAPDGFRMEHNGVSVVFLGGAGSIDRAFRNPLESWWPDEILSPGIIETLEGVCEVVVSHDCPDWVDLPLDPSFGEYFEKRDPGVLAYCEANRRVLGEAVDALRPRLVVHGHYHMETVGFRVLPGSDGVGTLVVGLDKDGSTMRGNVKTAASVLGLSPTL